MHLDGHAIALGFLTLLFALLLFANLAFTVVASLRMRNRGETNNPRSPQWGNAYIRGWYHRDLRVLMALWTLAMLALPVVTCALLGGILL